MQQTGPRAMITQKKTKTYTFNDQKSVGAEVFCKNVNNLIIGNSYVNNNKIYIFLYI